ncbi:MAG TPA: FGGY family carbohydrate kinase [Acidobacteriaceae bacterium]|nr:FGGY family carbohydrate kinase [Acidobacteriaceae bacterium]
MKPERRAVVAIDLGAESCRVSLLRWNSGNPEITLAHRFPNGPVQCGNDLRWDLDAIWTGVNEGLRRAADLAPEGIESIGVDGWAVDYVRLGPDGQPLTPPFCYRDRRNAAAEAQALQKISAERLYRLTGIQSLSFNTVYQLCADNATGISSSAPWINLPEYILHRLGGRMVSEYTNATHTGLVDLKTKNWCPEIFAALGLDLAAAPELVPSGTGLGRLSGPLAALPAFRNTRLIAPACHDTASAIAGIPAGDGNWAYISSGTWSLVGAVLPRACAEDNARERGFTNLGAAGGGVCFHVNVNGMWLLSQCMKRWPTLDLDSLIAAAEKLPSPGPLLQVDDPELLLPGDMPHRINLQRQRLGLAALPESPASAPAFAGLIFHSLAARYAEILSALPTRPGEIFIVGGGSRNQFLNRLTEQAAGIRVSTGNVESSTIGNFAIQLAALNQSTRPTAENIAYWARVLKDA